MSPIQFNWQSGRRHSHGKRCIDSTPEAGSGWRQTSFPLGKCVCACVCVERGVRGKCTVLGNGKQHHCYAATGPPNTDSHLSSLEMTRFLAVLAGGRLKLTQPMWTNLRVQWNLPIVDTLAPLKLSLIQRCVLCLGVK